MTKTSLEITHQALRVLAVLAKDEVVHGEDATFCKDVLEAGLDELSLSQGFSFDWTVETVPDTYFTPLSHFLAARVAPHYLVAAPVTESRAVMMMRALHFQDDRSEDFDADGDGVLSDDEAAAEKRAAFY